MRIKGRKFLKDRAGERKIVRKFMWFPTNFDEKDDNRWLEFADVVYEVKPFDYYGNISHRADYKWDWTPIAFIDSKEYNKRVQEIEQRFTMEKNALIAEMLAAVAE